MTDITINTTEDDVLGPMVILARLIYDQDSGEHWAFEEMPALLAHTAILYDSENGTTVRRAKIIYNGVLDLWSQSL